MFLYQGSDDITQYFYTYMCSVRTVPQAVAQPKGSLGGPGPLQIPITIFTDYETCPGKRRIQPWLNHNNSQRSDEEWL